MFNKQLVLRRIKQVLLHILFWCGVLLFYSYFFGYGTNDIRYVLSFSLFLMPITITLTYFSLYKLIPSYLITKKYFLFGLYSLYTLIISSYLIVLSIFYGLIYLSHLNYTNMSPISRNIFFVMIGVYLVVFTASTFKSLRLNLKILEEKGKLKTKIIETQLQLKEQELNYLKMQVHPHFLFNTLNTLYGFSLKKADETPEMILRLSNLLDYLLYHVNEPFVLLKEEIFYLEDYIELEKMRFNSSLNISFTHQIPDKTIVAPMIFLPFIENSFKHGSFNNGKLDIIIHMSVMNKNILFTIENSSKKHDHIKNGIGLENIYKRLNILYPQQYSLIIKNECDSFKVTLKLPHNIEK